MVIVNVKVDTRQLRRALTELKKQAPKAIARALNRTASTAQTQAKRAIAKDMKLTQAAVAKGLRVDKARAPQLTATLTATGHRIPLIEFKARQTQKGVTYNLGRGRKLAPHAFIATMRSGHRGVFQRKAGVPRLSIYELKGPSIPRILARKNIGIAIRARGRENLSKNLAHEIDYLLSRQGARRT